MNKARQFEDFILDDYDYNLLEDWDLEYLWEWVEFDDFSDLEQEFIGGQDFDPDGDASHQNLNNDDFDKSMSKRDNYDDNTSINVNNDNLDDNNDNDFNAYDDDDNQYDENDNLDIDENDEISQEDDEDDYSFDFDYNDLDEDNHFNDEHEDNTNNSYDESDEDGDAFLRSIGLLDDDDEQESDDNEDNEYEDDYTEDNDDDYILGGPRYIETSAGIIDLELDDILGKLQRVEFDEFIDVLKKYNHAYDKILIQQDWSEEEMDFLKSIEPLIRNQDELSEAHHSKKEKKSSRNKNNTPKTPEDNKIIKTQSYANVKEMFDALAEKAKAMALKNLYKRQYTTKSMNKIWNIDTDEKRAKRIKLIFGDNIVTISKDTLKPQMQTTRNHLSEVIYGKNESRYVELIEILSKEIKMMCENLDQKALDFIQQDGRRFGSQFMGFLVQKYGSKIYYLYQSQLKNDISADRLSIDLTEIFNKYTQFKNTDIFLTQFFASIIDTLEEQGIDF